LGTTHQRSAGSTTRLAFNTKWAAHSAHLIAARKVAQLVLDADCCLASQHLKGDLNFVADPLPFAGSRARAGGKRHPIAFDDPPNDIITKRFHLCYPQQIPKTFAMSQLPSEIFSWVSSMLQTAASSMIADRRAATRTKTEPGADGWDSAERQASLLIPSSLACRQSELFCHAFFSCLRSSGWTTGGICDGQRKQPVVASTVQKAAGHVAAAFRHNLQPSPFHLKGSTQLHPFAKALFQAFNNVDPAAKRQQAITPKLLRGMFRLAGAAVALTHDSPAAIIAESSIVAFFFAMRSCECTTTPTPGGTKTINLAGAMFRNRNK
jgi:hypothetical protein